MYENKSAQSADYFDEPPQVVINQGPMGSDKRADKGPPEFIKKMSTVIGSSMKLQQDEDVEVIPGMSEEEKFQILVTAALVGLLIISIIEFSQALQVCLDEDECKGLTEFAVALGAVSSLCCLAILTAKRFVKKRPKGIENNSCIDNTVLPFASIFLTLWWTVGVVACTFKEPFEETGNGYFTCWLAFMLSLYFCLITISKFGAILLKCKNNLGDPLHRALVIIAFLSFMEAYACILQLDEVNAFSDKKSTPQEYFGMYCGFISGGLVIFALILETKLGYGKPGVLSYLLIPLWLFETGVVTFDQPFLETGNGYFCAWGAFCMSCYLFYLHKTEIPGPVLERFAHDTTEGDKTPTRR